jgi:acetylornithine deacetylase/succinyl-diaminopimelate desuccinylase-like protein
MTPSLLLLSLLVAAPPLPAADRALARQIFAELVAMDTSHETGETTGAARALARRLRQEGFPASSMKVLGNSPRKQNLVVRLQSPLPAARKRKPLLLLGHLDVVQALRTDWSLPPYQLTEKDGFFYGRGTQDMKGQVAIWVATFIRLKREKVPLDRDLIVALTADEERATTEDNGVRWLLEKHRALIDAELALNEGGGGEIKDGRRRANDVQASEKNYLSFRLEIRNKGGHSSLPEKDNAIVRLAEGLGRLGKYQFPAALDPVARAYFARLADIEGGSGSSDNRSLAADMRTLAATAAGAPLDPGALARLSAVPYYNARLRTTCVPTRLEGGHADNALPQLAAALVNCRLLPGEAGEAVKATLVRVLADPGISVTALGAPDSGPVGAPARDFLTVVERVSGRHFPGVPVLPVMSAGATDGRMLRAAGIPTFGVSGIFHDVADSRAHGRDERIGVEAFYEAQAFLYDLVKELATAPAPAAP